MTPAEHSDRMTRRAAEAVVTLMRANGIPPTVRQVNAAMGMSPRSGTSLLWLERAVAQGLLCAGPARASRRFYPVPRTETVA